MQDTPAPDTPPRQTWGRFAGILALFALVGPFLGAVGAVLMFVAMAVVTDLMQGRLDNLAGLMGRGLLTTLVAGLPIAYSFGAVSSVAVGLVVALRDRWRGGITWRAGLGSAVAMWALMAGLAALVIPADGFLLWLAGLFVAHVVAAGLCTWLARRILGCRPPAARGGAA